MSQPRQRVVDEKKQCTKCNEWLPLIDFPPNKKNSTGLGSWCRACLAIYKRGPATRKPRKPFVDGKKQCSKCERLLDALMFYRDRNKATGYAYQCKECSGTKHPNVLGGPKKAVIDGMKQCTICMEWKALEKFEAHATSAHGRGSRCKSCNLKRNTERYGSSISEFLKYIANAHHQSLKFRFHRRTKKRGKPELWQQSCISPMFLEVLWSQQKGRCAITGVPMEHVMGKGPTQRNVSIDRIDSNVGYIPDNVQLVCKIVNLMKHIMNLDELRYWCQLILQGSEPTRK